ncbi:MAG: hypothetical protein LBK02_09270 [Treponema sp.]|jgi:hypothetical protein|nr:hypothetical protein [Treponema sp.]
MKKIIQVLTAGLLAAGLLAACAPAFEPDIDERYNLQGERSSTDYGIRVSQVTAETDTLQVQPASNGYPQRIILQVADTNPLTNNSINFDIGAGNQIPGLSIHLLTAATQYTLYNEVDPALNYSAYSIAKNQVELVMPFNDSILTSTATKHLIVKLDPTKVTFNGGKGRLNRDNDSRPGEAEEDAQYFYYTNVTPPVGYGGQPYTTFGPNDGLRYYTGTIANPAFSGDFPSQGGPSLAVSSFTIDSSLSGTPNTEFRADDLVKAFRFEKFYPAEGVWRPLKPTSQTFNTGTLTISFGADNPTSRDIARYMIDPYLIVSSKKAGGDNRGTTIRGSYNQSIYTGANGSISKDDWTYLGPFDSPSTPSRSLSIASAALLTAPPSITVSGFRGNYFIDLTVNTSGTGVFDPVLDIVTLRNKGNIRIFQKKAAAYNGDVVAELTIDPQKITLLSGNQFRIYLPADYAPLSGTPAGNLEVRIANVILNFKQGSSSGTPTTAYFFQPNGSVDETGAYRFEVKFP